MNSIKKALLYGFLTWLIPFISAFPFYSRGGELVIDMYLFKTIMMVMGAITGAIFLFLYFKDVNQKYLREGLSIGLIWLVINWLLDFVILLPMADMSTGDYWTQIGLRYLTIPIFSVMVGYLLEHRSTSQ